VTQKEAVRSCAFLHLSLCFPASFFFYFLEYRKGKFLRAAVRVGYGNSKTNASNRRGWRRGVHANAVSLSTCACSSFLLFFLCSFPSYKFCIRSPLCGGPSSSVCFFIISRMETKHT
jgi:hypothetical protein